ncbi:MAG: hypothetical protein AB1552_13350 [Nitrospirota bacterium]
MGKRILIRGMLVYLAVLFYYLLVGSLGLCLSTTYEQPGFEVKLKENLISLQAKEAEISDVLKDIGLKTGLRMNVGKDLLGKKIDASFENLDIETAVREIIRDTYYVLTFKQQLADKEKYVLSEVKASGNSIGTYLVTKEITTINISYGSGDIEVGFVNEGEGAIVGPKSFAVDSEGNRSHVNRCVKSI